MLDQDFCDFLEFKITKALSSFTSEQLKGFWCDGVQLPNDENEYSKKHVNDRRQIVMTAFTGKTGQEIYELILCFGNKSLSRYVRNLRLEECLPNNEDNYWLEVDPINKKMVLQLD